MAKNYVSDWYKRDELPAQPKINSESLKYMPSTKRAAEELARSLCYKYAGNPDISECKRHFKNNGREELVTDLRGQALRCLSNLRVTEVQNKDERGNKIINWRADGVRLEKEKVTVSGNGHEAERTSLPDGIEDSIRQIAARYDVDYQYQLLCDGGCVSSATVLPYSGSDEVSVIFMEKKV